MKRFILLLIFIFMLSGIVVTHKANAPEQSVRVWGVKDSKAYAKDKLLEWQENQYRCLDKLWTRESQWNPKSYNKIKVMGKNAGGIPQILGMSIHTPAPQQIDRGLSYIIYRYGTPCQAWKFHQRKGWY